MSSPRVLPVLFLLAGAMAAPIGAVDVAEVVPVVSWSLTGAQGYADVHHVLLSDGSYIVVDHGVLVLEARVEADLVEAMVEVILGSGSPRDWVQGRPDPGPWDILATISVFGGAATYSYVLDGTPKLPEPVATVERAFHRIMNLVLASSGWAGNP